MRTDRYEPEIVTDGLTAIFSMNSHTHGKYCLAEETESLEDEVDSLERSVDNLEAENNALINTIDELRLEITDAR